MSSSTVEQVATMNQYIFSVLAKYAIYRAENKKFFIGPGISTDTYQPITIWLANKFVKQACRGTLTFPLKGAKLEKISETEYQLKAGKTNIFIVSDTIFSELLNHPCIYLPKDSYQLALDCYQEFNQQELSNKSIKEHWLVTKRTYILMNWKPKGFEYKEQKWLGKVNLAGEAHYVTRETRKKIVKKLHGVCQMLY
jgi:hypothetical protein